MSISEQKNNYVVNFHPEYITITNRLKKPLYISHREQLGIIIDNIQNIQNIDELKLNMEEINLLLMEFYNSVVKYWPIELRNSLDDIYDDLYIEMERIKN